MQVFYLQITCFKGNTTVAVFDCVIESYAGPPPGAGFPGAGEGGFPGAAGGGAARGPTVEEVD